MKKILIVGALLALVGCDNRPLDQREYSKTTLNNIPELADCVYIKIDEIRIFRCPNSSTSATYAVSSGKSKKTVTTTVVTGDDK